ncbi:MAG: Asp-tRNA(Asn)/Glu-tRNA(Gln) amidotransferase subunit GatC [Alphaproteobacteria bacterium]|nr:Asp-tRNA(Asn)/Glu-tRNA(Gln) amidotransferase subunit GatC [Alphaproteobacteria bacterium]MCK5659013.1 Asp-tRNA(Asn)/Glu-tRNA(Gln) amidotransferase subunit GatC [Alphaproteobacteria bacterium]
MSIDKNTVRKVARLARIRINDDGAEVLSGELSNILEMIEQLNEVDTKGVEPMTSVIEMQMPEREDIVTDGGIPEKILSNAPDHTAGFFVVPKVME